jgi:hypothetical protein
MRPSAAWDPRGRLSSALFVLLVAIVCTSCAEGIDAGVLADEQERGAAARGRPSMLEFDLPDEFWTKDAEGRYVVTGFRLGYFQPSNTDPMVTVEIARDAVVVTGKSGRVPLGTDRLPENVSTFTLRIQTLTRTAASAWSEPSSSTSAAAATGRSAAKAPRDARPSKRLSMSEIERYPRLLEAMKKTLPPGGQSEALLAPYRNAEELAIAVVLCRDNGIPLEKFSQAMTGPPRRSLRNAARVVKPELRKTTAMEKARAEAKDLLKVPPAAQD